MLSAVGCFTGSICGFNFKDENRREVREVTKFEALQQMPLSSFASLVFSIIERDCKTLEDFEAFLKQEIPQHLEESTKRTLYKLQELQCSDRNRQEEKEVSNQMIEEQMEHKDSVISDVDNVIKAVSKKIINGYVSIEMEPSTIEALASLITARTSMNYNPFSKIDTV